MVQMPTRGIKLHEYQAAGLLNKFKVAIPLGETATTVDQAYTIAKKFHNGCVIKSQILGGGRGLGHFKET
jgi:succinyl-CoA synthetase beta subunit